MADWPPQASHARAGAQRCLQGENPPDTSACAHKIAVDLREPVVQRALDSSPRIGPRADAVDERDAGSVVVTGCGGASCKIAVHIDGCGQTVVHALKSLV